MGDFAKGIKSFKKNMADDSDESMEAGADKPATGSIAAPGPQAGTTAGTTASAQPHTAQKA
jgi:sec-independent protein translocase protein TatA